MRIDLRASGGADGCILALRVVDRVVPVYVGAALFGYAESQGSFSFAREGKSLA